MEQSRIWIWICCVGYKSSPASSTGERLGCSEAVRVLGKLTRIIVLDGGKQWGFKQVLWNQLGVGGGQTRSLGNATELLTPEDASQAWYSLLEREGKTWAHGRKASHKAFGSVNAEKLFLPFEVRVLTWGHGRVPLSVCVAWSQGYIHLQPRLVLMEGTKTPRRSIPNLIKSPLIENHTRTSG